MKTEEKEKLKSTLTSILHREPNIKFAYLYGSTARSTRQKQSDVDIGIYLSENTLKRNKFYPERLSGKIEEEIHQQVDVRVLNHQNIIFLHQVLKHGELLINKDNKKRVLFETRVYDEYLDFKYYIDQYNLIRREHISS